MSEQLPVDLLLATNMHGPLGSDVLARLAAVIDNPTNETWQDAHSIILNRDVGLGVTLWQAVCELDPSYKHIGPRSAWIEDDSDLGGHSEPISGWAKIPPADLIRQAINYATR